MSVDVRIFPTLAVTNIAIEGCFSCRLPLANPLQEAQNYAESNQLIDLANCDCVTRANILARPDE